MAVNDALRQALIDAEDLFSKRGNGPIDPLIVRPAAAVNEDVIHVHAGKQEQ